MFCKCVELPQNGTFSAGLELGLGVGVGIVFTAALVLAILGYVIVWLLRRKCRNQSGKKHMHLNQTKLLRVMHNCFFAIGRISATQPVYELPSTQERNTNDIRTQPNPGYGVHHHEKVKTSTEDDYDYI